MLPFRENGTNANYFLRDLYLGKGELSKTKAVPNSKAAAASKSTAVNPAKINAKNDNSKASQKINEDKVVVSKVSKKALPDVIELESEDEKAADEKYNSDSEDVDSEDPEESDGYEYNSSQEDETSDNEDGSSGDDGEESDGFEQQSSDDSDIESEDENSVSDEEIDPSVRKIVHEAETTTRDWSKPVVGKARSELIESERKSGQLALQRHIDVDDLSEDDDEDGNRNTIGRVPLHWYDAYDHIGYNISGDKLIRGKGKDRIDMALSASDPLAGRTVYDMYNDREIVLTDRELEIIRRMKAGAFAHPEHDSMPEYVDYESSIREVMPLSAAPEPKRRFLPSKWEMMRVMKIVKAMKEGKYVTIKDRRKRSDPSDVYQIWNDQEDEIIAESKRYQYHLPAPKMPLPGHAESYNPPSEYLLTNEEKKEIEDNAFIPQKFSCLRHVPGYNNLVKERFERCLDLYLCPRKMKRRLNIDPETLVPKLPQPKDLKPFPNHLTLQYLGHSKPIRSICVSPDGLYLVSGSDDGSVRLWEVDTTLCRYVWQLGEQPVLQVAWNPNPSHHVIAAVCGKELHLITTGTGDADNTEVTEALLAFIEDDINGNGSTDDDHDAAADKSMDDDDDDNGNKTKKAIKSKDIGKWMHCSPRSKSQVLPPIARVGPRVKLVLHGDISHLCWHYKGDYLATVCPTLGPQMISIHQLSKAKSQCPFNKTPGNVQAVSFHPSRPFLFIVTQQHIRLYHLVEQKLVKKLISGCKWISSIDIHPSGDHVIVGSYDRRVVWFDLDLSSTPYKTLKFHEKAIRSVQYHK